MHVFARPPLPLGRSFTRFGRWRGAGWNRYLSGAGRRRGHSHVVIDATGRAAVIARRRDARVLGYDRMGVFTDRGCIGTHSFKEPIREVLGSDESDVIH